jgi:hypothetical protein
MVTIKTNNLEKQINDHVTELFSPGWTFEEEKPYVHFSNNSKKLRVQFTKDKFIYQINLQGRTKPLQFVIIFHLFLDKSTLFVHTNNKVLKVSDNFCKKTMNSLVPVTNGVRKKL